MSNASYFGILTPQALKEKLIDTDSDHPINSKADTYNFYINREKNPMHAEQMLLCYCENVTKLASNLEFQHFRHNNISVEGDSV